MLVFENAGRIENCSVKGDIHLILNNTHAQANSDCGGMVSCNSETGVIENSYARLNFTWTVTGGSRTYLYRTACFVNRNEGQIKNCYSASRAKYSNDEFRGFSTRTNMYTGIYENCYYDKDLPGIYSEGYDTDESYHKYPRTTAAMKTQYNYTGWDFDEIWAIDESINDGYPYLRNEKSITIQATGLTLDRTEAAVQGGGNPHLAAGVYPAECHQPDGGLDHLKPICGHRAGRRGDRRGGRYRHHHGHRRGRRLYRQL